MLSKKMEKAINDQITWEFYSAYIYLAMAGWFQEQGLPGFGNWMEVQYQEEVFHATKMFHYVLEAGGSVDLGAIAKPKVRWKKPVDAFQEALAHEQGVTARINALVDLAQKEKDHATNNFYQWFVSEQVEEEANVTDILGKLKLVGDGGALFMLDKDLAARVFTPPAGA
ncbi:MAG TPA: ferritin [Desulfovibrio sp.]|jgi:ferritin|nr:ferritin [Desulfovibrio sp.]